MKQGTSLVKGQRVFIRQAQKDSKKIAAAEFRSQNEELFTILRKNPFNNPHTIKN